MNTGVQITISVPPQVIAWMDKEGIALMAPFIEGLIDDEMSRRGGVTKTSHRKMFDEKAAREAASLNKQACRAPDHAASELGAMKAVVDSLDSLSQPQRARVLNWTRAFYGGL